MWNLFLSINSWKLFPSVEDGDDDDDDGDGDGDVFVYSCAVCNQ